MIARMAWWLKISPRLFPLRAEHCGFKLHKGEYLAWYRIVYNLGILYIRLMDVCGDPHDTESISSASFFLNAFNENVRG